MNSFFDVKHMNTTELSLFCYLLFIVVGLILYLIMPKKAKWTVLLVLSFALSFILTAYWIIFIIFIILLAFFTGIWIDKYNKKYKEEKEELSKDERKELKKKYNKKQKAILLSSLFIAFLTLALLKYFHLPLGTLNNIFEKYYFLDIAFPILGISYYILIAASYMIDIYRGKYESQRNIFKLALFIGYFPLQIEGPISRYDNLSKQLYKTENPTFENFEDGFSLIVWGLFKKIVIADRINIYVAPIFNNYYEYSGHLVLLGMIFFVIQLYCDFSGLIDIARGASRMFGIELEKNFDEPFKSRSVGEFWRRWHITLGTWFRDYIFYPIALSKPMMKLSKKLHGNVKEWVEKLLINAIPLFFVWLLCGIWHGAGIKYIVYGMYYFLIILIETALEPINKKIFKKDNWFIHCLSILKTLVLVTIGMTLFRANSVTDFGKMICKIFSNRGQKDLYSIIEIFDFKIFVVSFIVLSTIKCMCCFKKTNEIFNNYWFKMVLTSILITCILLYGAYGANYGDVDPFYALF